MRKPLRFEAGFTLVEIMVVVVIIGLLAAIAIPNFVRARRTSQTNACINNLRQIDSAKRLWALEQGKRSTDLPLPADLNPYLGRNMGGRDMYCPLSARTAWGGYSSTIEDIGTLPSCANYDAPLTSGGSHPASLDTTKQ